MKWELTKRTAILGRALACGFFLTVLAGFFPFAAASEELPQNIVRLHVVANSDSEEDQAVKLLVRDAVLEEAARWYGGARTMEEASARLCTHLESIAKTAQATLREQGMGYSATAQVTEMYFPTRDYESFRLPAGRYRTLRVTVPARRQRRGGAALPAGGAAEAGGGLSAMPGQAQGRGAVGGPAGMAAGLMGLFRGRGMWYNTL